MTVQSLKPVQSLKTVDYNGGGYHKHASSL